MILVTGATGTTGGAVVRSVLEHGAPVRALVRSSGDVAALRALGVEDVVVGDLMDPSSLEPAFKGVERFYLVSPAGERQAEMEGNAIAVAERSGAYAVVKLGALGQSHQSPTRFGRSHAAVFDTLQGTSLRWTLLQANSMFQNVLGSAAPIAAGWFGSALGDARVSRVDARDVGAVAARALTQEGHESCSYTLTGPEAISDPEIAAQLGEVLGRDVAYRRTDDDELAEALRAGGVPEWTVAGIGELSAFERSGSGAGVAPDVHALLGRPATAFRRFAEDHRARFDAPGFR